jgi:DNA-directed RNA polymerase subunit RPC12/RpoP
MKATSLGKMRCLACGGELRIIDKNDRYECQECGESIDLKGFMDIEVELEAFDKLLLYSLKNKGSFTGKGNKRRHMNTRNTLTINKRTRDQIPQEELG